MTSRLVCLDGELPVSKLHRCLLSSDSSNNYNIATVDITADLARLRSHNSCLATGPPVCPCNVPCLIVCTDNPLLVVAALSWLDDDVCPSYILLPLSRRSSCSSPHMPTSMLMKLC
uniref:Uncharacterized protein n=1 Tax=Oryza rufipogon TaxID=4529 RepID=A0A0E0PSB1_ORYRU